MFIYINSTNSDYLELALQDQLGNVVDQVQVPAHHQQSEKLLPTTNQLLRKNKLKLNQLSGIIVANGQGSFSSLRLGITVANVLGYALGLPVISRDLKTKNTASKVTAAENKDLIAEQQRLAAQPKTFSLVLPQYEQEPNISLPKKKATVDNYRQNKT